MGALLPALLRLARQYPGMLARPEQCCGARGLQAAASAAAAALPPPPPRATARAPAGCQRQQRRPVAAAAGRRGNVFLDDSPRQGGGGDEPQSAAVGAAWQMAGSMGVARAGGSHQGQGSRREAAEPACR